jgi:hypothetical protein
MQMLDEAPSFASVADKIGDRRLEKMFQHLAPNIKTEINNAKFVPLRAEVRNDVKRLKAETKRFETALNRVFERRLWGLPIEVDVLGCLGKQYKTSSHCATQLYLSLPPRAA